MFSVSFSRLKFNDIVCMHVYVYVYTTVPFRFISNFILTIKYTLDYFTNRTKVVLNLFSISIQ